MKIKQDLLRISSGALNLKGDRLEPEEQLVRREITTAAETKLGAGQTGTVVGALPTQIITETTVADMAQSVMSMCGNCKHYRNDLWLRDLKNADSPGAPIEKRRMVNKIRAALMQTQNAGVAEQSAGADGDFDVEHALRMLGYCKALYEFLKAKGESTEDAMVLVHPASRCPEDVQKSVPPVGFFEFASEEARQIAAKNYDNLLQTAQGKK